MLEKIVPWKQNARFRLIWTGFGLMLGIALLIVFTVGALRRPVHRLSRAEFYCLNGNCAFLQKTGKDYDETHNNKVKIRPIGSPATDSAQTPILVKYIEGTGENKKHDLVELSPTEGFILGSLLQQVPRSQLIAIMQARSAEPITAADADAIIDNAVTKYSSGENQYIRAMTSEEISQYVKMPFARVTKKLPIKKYFSKLDLDASIHQLGPIVIKITWPPK